MHQIFDLETGTLNLSKLDRDKTWVIFYKKTCSGCNSAKAYMNDNNISYEAYNLDTAEGCAMACLYEVIDKCKKMLPVIVEK